jgi:hypothetical protein
VLELKLALGNHCSTCTDSTMVCRQRCQAALSWPSPAMLERSPHNSNASLIQDVDRHGYRHAYPPAVLVLNWSTSALLHNVREIVHMDSPALGSAKLTIIYQPKDLQNLAAMPAHTSDLQPLQVCLVT